jgi:hypothetical protein
MKFSAESDFYLILNDQYRLMPTVFLLIYNIYGWHKFWVLTCSAVAWLSHAYVWYIFYFPLFFFPYVLWLWTFSLPSRQSRTWNLLHVLQQTSICSATGMLCYLTICITALFRSLCMMAGIVTLTTVPFCHELFVACQTFWKSGKLIGSN